MLRTLTKAVLTQTVQVIKIDLVNIQTAFQNMQTVFLSSLPSWFSLNNSEMV